MFLAAALTLAGASPANASHGNPATDVIAGTVTGNVAITSPNGIPGPAEQAEPTTYDFTDVLVVGTIKTTDSVAITGVIEVSDVAGGAAAENEAAAWGYINDIDNQAAFRGVGLTVDPPGPPVSGAVEGTFYGTFVRVATNLILGLTARYEVAYSGKSSYSGGGNTEPGPMPVSAVTEFIPTSYNVHGHPEEAVFAGSFFEPGQPVAVEVAHAA